MLENLEYQPFIRPCRVRTIKETLNEKDQAKLEAAVMNKSWGAKKLERDLRKLGIELSDTSIEKHRMEACSCWKI